MRRAVYYLGIGLWVIGAAGNLLTGDERWWTLWSFALLFIVLTTERPQ